VCRRKEKQPGYADKDTIVEWRREVPAHANSLDPKKYGSTLNTALNERLRQVAWGEDLEKVFNLRSSVSY